MWYLFHGTDEFSAREALAALRAEDDFGYNQDTFKGAEVSLATWRRKALAPAPPRGDLIAVAWQAPA